MTRDEFNELSATDALAAVGIRHIDVGGHRRRLVADMPSYEPIPDLPEGLGMADFVEAGNLARFIRAREDLARADLLKAARRARATLHALGHRAEPGNVLAALSDAIARAEGQP